MIIDNIETKMLLRLRRTFLQKLWTFMKTLFWTSFAEIWVCQG